MVESKSQPGFSVCRSCCALAVDTYEMATLASITGLLVVLKVRNAAAGLVCPDSVITWEAVNGWLKMHVEVHRVLLHLAVIAQLAAEMAAGIGAGDSLFPTTWAVDESRRSGCPSA